MTEQKQKKRYMIVSVVVLTLIMNIVDGYVKPPYALKSLIKVLLFFVVPLVYCRLSADGKARFKSMLVFRKKGTLSALVAGFVCFAAILGAYFILKERFDFSGITKALTADSGITPDNFAYTALYISFCNSFLEEFFFRGYAFFTLKQHTGRAFAYLFSAFFFAFYHVGMTFGWVHTGLFFSELAALMLGGMLFNFLNEKTETIYPSWIVHMFCNFGINTVGFLLFGMI